MDKYKNKYRISSTRWQYWDYRWAGAYFITICTQNREHYFGEISQGIMEWSPVGIIADVLWYQIPHHTKNVELGAFVVMPNHIHGILIIHDGNVDNDNVDNDNVDNDNVDNDNVDNDNVDNDNVDNDNVDNDNVDNDNVDNDNVDNDNVDNNNVDNDNVDNDNVETGHALSLHPTNNPTNPSIQPPTIGQQRFQNIGKNSISSIVGSYKSAVTKHANRLGLKFQWQPRFHDHIIRDDQSYQRISEYIMNNPTNWKEDKFYNSEQ